MKINTDRIAVFEEVNPEFIPIVNKYLREEFIVYFFNMEDRLGKQKVIKKYIETNRLIDLSKKSFDHILDCRTLPHKNVDQLFNKYFSKSRLIKITSNLLKSTEIENMYKKELLRNLHDIYEIELRINNLNKNNSNVIYFYPSKNFEIYLDESSLLSKNIKVVVHKSLKIKINSVFRHIKDVLTLFYPMYLLFRKIKMISWSKTPPKKYKIGLRLNFPGIFSYNYFLIDYIIDESYKIPKHEILLLDESDESGLPNGFFDTIFWLMRPNKISMNMDESKKQGYNCTHITKTKEIICVDFLWNKIIKDFLPAWIKCFIHSFSEGKINLNTTRVILSDYIIWNIFIDNHSIDNHIAILLPDNISKNVILSSNNIKTGLIYPDNSATDYHTGQDEKQQTSIIFSFMNSDYAVIYGNKIKRFLIYNRNNVKNYITLGVLAAQIVRELKEGKSASKLPSLLKKKNLPAKIIGVFDTSYTEFTPLKIKDGIRFGEDILRLLDDMPEIGVVFKEKKFTSVTPRLAPVYEKLENHERCVFVRKAECIFSTEVIALSDLVISAAYTSTNAEALGAKTKAIYYDVAGTDIGDNYYFNKFPNFVAHDYEELKRLVNYWLYEVTDEKFENFLNTYVKDEIDPYLDGKAIDRLQILLDRTC